MCIADMDDEQKREVVGAMKKVSFAAGAVIIKYDIAICHAFLLYTSFFPPPFPISPLHLSDPTPLPLSKPGKTKMGCTETRSLAHYVACKEGNSCFL